jgi:hypothetical protein
MPVYRLLENSVFEPHDIEAIAQAFEAVCILLKLPKGEDSMRDLVAQSVIKSAQRGERDPERLCKLALSKLQRDPDLTAD